MSKKTIISLIILPFLLISYLFWQLGSNYHEYKLVQKNFNQLRVGMTKSEVISLVGKPKDTFFWRPTDQEKPTEERWILHFPPNSEQLPSCIFNLETGKVIRIEKVDSDYLF